LKKVCNNVYIGTSSDAENIDLLRECGITAILNVAHDLNRPWVSGTLSLKAGLTNGPCEDNEAATQAAIAILKASVSGGRIVLVHCHDGKDRAPYVVSRYLSEKKKTDWKEEFQKIKILAPDVQILPWMDGDILDVVAVMVVKDDVYYVDMSIKSVQPYVKGVYIQDQFSTDGTYEKILGIMQDLQLKGSCNIVVERVDTGHKERFAPGYNEPYWRTQALKRAEAIFSPAWLLKIDADDMFTEYFFKKLDGLLTPDFKFESVRVSGDRPISKDYWATEGSYELEKTEYSPEGGRFGDPHTQLWRAGKYYFERNPGLPETMMHPILTPQPRPEYWLAGLCNYHLHRTFGPKAIAFWHEGHDIYGLEEVIDDSKPLYPPTSCPEFYNHHVNMATAEKRDFKWPDYVLERWSQWQGGCW